MAMEPTYVTLGFSNSGKEAIQIVITDTTTQSAETIEIPANQTVERTFELTEPGVTELLVENTDPNSTDQAYIVRLYAETDENGMLQGYAVAQIEGTEDKSAELVFGVTNDETEDPTKPENPTKPEKPTKPENPTEKQSGDDPANNSGSKTGDSANMTLWVLSGAGFAAVVCCLIIFMLVRRRKEDGENK